MTTTDKVIIGSTIVIASSAIAMLIISSKYDMMTAEILSELHGIHNTMIQSHEDIIAGNQEITKSNKILRKIVVESATVRARK